MDGCRVDYRIELPRQSAVTAHSSAGEIELTGVGGRVDARTEAGRIAGRDLAAAVVSARTSAGEVDLHFAEVPDDVTATTAAGQGRVRLPRGATYDVDADTGVGHTDVAVDTSARSPHTIAARSEAGSVRVAYR